MNPSTATAARDSGISRYTFAQHRLKWHIRSRTLQLHSSRVALLLLMVFRAGFVSERSVVQGLIFIVGRTEGHSDHQQSRNIHRRTLFINLHHTHTWEIQSQEQHKRYMTILHVGDIPEAYRSTPSTSRSPSYQRRKRSNKYANFSKVDALTYDPLEQLMAESLERNRQFEKEKKSHWVAIQQQQQRFTLAAAPLSSSSLLSSSLTSTEAPKIVSPLRITAFTNFPDTKNIDPYDPTSFGYVAIGKIVGAHGVHGWVKVQRNDYDNASGRSRTSSCSNQSTESPLTLPGSMLHIKPPRKRAPRSILLVAGRHCVKDFYLCLLDGVQSRNDAQRLRGCMVYQRKLKEQEQDLIRIPQSTDGQRIQQDESSIHYDVSDLVGLSVHLYNETHATAADPKAKLDDAWEFTPCIGVVGGVVLEEDISDLPLGYDMLEIILARQEQKESQSSSTSSFIPLSRKIEKEERVLIPLVQQLVPVFNLERRAIFIDPPAGLLDLRYVQEDKVRIKGILPPATCT